MVGQAVGWADMLVGLQASGQMSGLAMLLNEVSQLDLAPLVGVWQAFSFLTKAIRLRCSYAEYGSKACCRALGFGLWAAGL